MMVFKPETKVRVQDKFDCDSVAGDPLQVAAARPERLSMAVPVMVICGVVTVAPETGEAIASDGGVLSIFSVTDAVAEPPVESVAVAEPT